MKLLCRLGRELNNIKVTLQAMGGGSSKVVKDFDKRNVPYSLVSYDDGTLHGVYKTDFPIDKINGYTNFFRCDTYRTVAYYYAKISR